MVEGGRGFIPEPPQLIDVIDDCGGFFYVDPPRGRKHKYDYLVWSPASVLHHGSTGHLTQWISTRKHPYGRRLHLRNQGTVTYALYKVKGFKHSIMVIFSNETEHRIL